MSEFTAARHAVVVPGGMYGPHTPLLMYAAEARGADRMWNVPRLDGPDPANVGRARHNVLKLPALIGVRVLIKACLNGSRLPGSHPALPVSPAEIAAAAAAAVAAGAHAVHVHPKDESGADTLAGEHVAATVQAVRDAAPGTPIGVTTGAWAATGGIGRLAAVRSWLVLPDFASVNWHEDGAEELAVTLLDRGVGVEAGLWTVAAVDAWREWPLRDRCLRALLEVVENLPERKAISAAAALVEAFGSAPVPALLHGEQDAAWPVFREAVRRGLDARIGLEDVLVLPDGSLANDNAALVATAASYVALHRPQAAE